MSKPKVLVTRPDVPKEAIDMLKEKCEVEISDQEKPIDKKVLLKMIAGKDGMMCMLTDSIDKEVIEAAGDQLKVIATMSVGYEHIDLKTCKEKNIKVSNTPGVSTDSVAELTVLLMLAAGRNLIKSATTIKNGEWKYAWGPVWLCGQGLKDSVIGVYGAGRIGQAIIQRVLPFGPKKILYNDVFHPMKPAEDLGAKYVEFDELLKESDFVVCMSNLTEDTKDKFCKSAFDKMKSNAVFVNTSRGGLVNQKDLHDAIKNKKIRAAALDVTLPEPLPKDDPLLPFENIIITPHVGSAETNVRIQMAKLAAENILLVLEKKDAKTPVEMPK